MAGYRGKNVVSCFYCINCGKQGIPIWRKRSRIREQGHRKALYCVNCKIRINHIEVRTEEEKRQFIEDFTAGRYAEEAERSIEFEQAVKD